MSRSKNLECLLGTAARTAGHALPRQVLINCLVKFRGHEFRRQGGDGICHRNESEQDSAVYRQALRGDLQVTFEEGTSVAWLYDLLKPHVTKLVVCDPRKSKSMREGTTQLQTAIVSVAPTVVGVRLCHLRHPSNATGRHEPDNSLCHV